MVSRDMRCMKVRDWVRVTAPKTASCFFPADLFPGSHIFRSLSRNGCTIAKSSPFFLTRVRVPFSVLGGTFFCHRLRQQSFPQRWATISLHFWMSSLLQSSQFLLERQTPEDESRGSERCGNVRSLEHPRTSSWQIQL